MAMPQNGKKKKAEPKHNLPPNELGHTLIIDETIHDDERFGNEYVLGGVLLESRNVLKFGEISEIRYKGTELKFHDICDLEFRIGILDEAASVVKSYYSVTTTKPKNCKWSRKEDRNVHRNSLKRIIEDVSADEDSDIHLIIDFNNKAKSGTVTRITEHVALHDNKNITYVMIKSRESFQLMTNDFPVGAMGQYYNRNDKQYVDHFGKKAKRSQLDEEEAIKDIVLDV